MLSSAHFAVIASALLVQEPAARAAPIQALQVIPAPTSEPWDEDGKRMFFRLCDRDQDSFLIAEEANRCIARRVGAPLPGPAFVKARDRDGDSRVDLSELLASTF